MSDVLQVPVSVRFSDVSRLFSAESGGFPESQEG